MKGSAHRADDVRFEPEDFALLEHKPSAGPPHIRRAIPLALTVKLSGTGIPSAPSLDVFACKSNTQSALKNIVLSPVRVRAPGDGSVPCFISQPVRSCPCQNSTSPQADLPVLPNIELSICRVLAPVLR